MFVTFATGLNRKKINTLVIVFIRNSPICRNKSTWNLEIIFHEHLIPQKISQFTNMLMLKNWFAVSQSIVRPSVYHARVGEWRGLLRCGWEKSCFLLCSKLKIITSHMARQRFSRVLCRYSWNMSVFFWGNWVHLECLALPLENLGPVFQRSVILKWTFHDYQSCWLEVCSVSQTGYLSESVVDVISFSLVQCS
jgi:hypothetical protein